MRQRRRFPLAAVVAGFAILMILPATARGQVSPGPLSRAHADLDAALKCFECHGRGDGGLDQQCVACHGGIKKLLDTGRGLHGREEQKDCSTCHPEHAGRKFNLIDWGEDGEAGFDHRRAGLLLTGRHAEIKCSACHSARYRQPVSGEPPRRREATHPGWLGLDRDCASCHEDPHKNQLGERCQSCHDSTAWRPAGGFDHQATSYPLTGGHMKVTCAQCHQPEGAKTPIYKPLSHQECSACHQDPHKERLGPVCSKCHTTDNFHKVDPKAFDHARTRYPLVGRHLKVVCADCHDQERAWGAKPAFTTCDTCHGDPHAGKATLASRKVDCASCHDLAGFKNSIYTAESHKASAYPLAGGHLEVACRKCHLSSGKAEDLQRLGSAGVLLRPTYQKCRDCHGDDHKGQFADRDHHGACEACHTVAGWRPSTYTPADHNKLVLGLSGRHEEVTCAACHGPQRPDLPPLPGLDVLGRAGVALAGLETRCESCHFDPHEGSFSQTEQVAGGPQCLSCHDTTSFLPSSVDAQAHQRYTFKLDGGHGAVPCTGCHEDLRQPPASRSLVAAKVERRKLLLQTNHENCHDCHSDPHGGQFAQHGGGDGCDACHDTGAFRPATRFNHDVDAAFALQGAHQNVACNRCHVQPEGGNEKDIILYRPLTSKCRDCHLNDGLLTTP